MASACEVASEADPHGRPVDGGVLLTVAGELAREPDRRVAGRPHDPGARAAPPAVALSQSRRARRRAGAGAARHDAGRHRQERRARRGGQRGQRWSRSGRGGSARSRVARSRGPSAAGVAALGRDRHGHRHRRPRRAGRRVQRRLQEAGTYHVIAISGGNIAILAGLTLAAFRLAGFLGPAAMLAAIAGLIAYAYRRRRRRVGRSRAR